MRPCSLHFASTPVGHILSALIGSQSFPSTLRVREVGDAVTKAGTCLILVVRVSVTIFVLTMSHFMLLIESPSLLVIGFERSTPTLESARGWIGADDCP